MGYEFRGLSGLGLSGLNGLNGQWTQVTCQIPDLWSSVLFSCSYPSLFSSCRKKMEAMVVEFDTFDSHPPFLLNGDVGTGCLRVAFQ